MINIQHLHSDQYKCTAYVVMMMMMMMIMMIMIMMIMIMMIMIMKANVPNYYVTGENQIQVEFF